MREITVEAKAKINLTLDVTGKRADGYHDLCTVMHQVPLCDIIKIKKNTSGKISLETNNGTIPNDSANLAYIAAEKFRAEFGIADGIEIYLEKNIPVGAGLAGGSADAAAILSGMNSLYDGLCSEDRLMQLGLCVGSDVPFCISGGTQLAEGRGEILTRLPEFPKCTIVIAKPEVFVSTKWVYTNLNAEKLAEHPDTAGFLKALETNDLHEATVRMYNVLENVTASKYPIIRTIKQKMIDGGALGSCMSGSGSSVFGVFNDYERAVYTAETLGEYVTETFVCI